MSDFCTKTICWFSTIRVFTKIHSYLFSKSSSKNLNYTPPKFYIAPEEWRLEDDPFLLGRPIFRAYVKLRWCITQQEVTPITPLKANMDTQKSHIWKEIHLKNHHFSISMLDFGGINHPKNIFPRKSGMLHVTKLHSFLDGTISCCFVCQPSEKRYASQNGSSPPGLGKKH